MKYFATMLNMLLALFLTTVSASGKGSREGAGRLADVASPYLRQHAGNPVDWYPWGEEAFAKARKENKPIFLSVGYSTCYWCHVMKRESFEDEGIARILNRHFVSIKVDRERRPDVDETYMIATQIITKGGGWPNSVFLTPDLKPFFAGTYFPREAFGRLLRQIAGQWRDSEKALRQDGERVSGIISKILNRRVASRSITPDVLKKARQEILTTADEFNGGFDTAPKFPNEPLLMFLLQLAAGHDDAEALGAVTRTLDYMLDGGIHDHVGGGFHRYATDNLWRIPHFEKMLYNQAQMVRVLLLAGRLTGKKRYMQAAERTLSYVERHMLSEKGAFYSAFDASDSEGREGTFYIWTPEQLNEVLGPQEGALAAGIFGVTSEGNFEGRTILHFPEPPQDLAATLNMTSEQFANAVSRIRAKLDAARNRRPAPHLDRKIVLSWNGMMIAAFAEAAVVLKKPHYARVAEKALSFIENNMKQADGSYLRSYFGEKAELAAQQEDYAFLALANVLTYDATRKQEYLQKAGDLTAIMITKFADREVGDFFMVGKTDTFTRGKTRTDGAVPSGNSTALEVFAMLANRSQNLAYRNHGDSLLAALSGLAVESPRSMAYVLRGADMMRRGEVGIVQYFARGTVRAEAGIDKTARKAVVSLSIAPGWHINSSTPLNEDFIPTSLSFERQKTASDRVVYPKAVVRKLKFSDGPMSLYEGDVQIAVPLSNELLEGVNLKLVLQVCSDEICLEPVEGVLLARP